LSNDNKEPKGLDDEIRDDDRPIVISAKILHMLNHLYDNGHTNELRIISNVISQKLSER